MATHLSSIADHIRFCFTRMNQAGVHCGHGYETTWDESVNLILQMLELPWDFSEDLWHCRITAAEQEAILDAISKRVDDRLPLAYITHKSWFCGLPFYVDERVLVPRSPIAELINNFFAPWLAEMPDKVLDLCTGSACIGIACAYAFDEAKVDCLDISPSALEVAARNVEQHDLGDRVRLVNSNLYDGLAPENRGTYDLIVSNPPYVDASDLSAMPKEFQREPALGLASGADGLDITRRILQESQRWLTDNGTLVVEVGNSWEALEAAYPEFPFTWIEFEQGGHGVFVMSAQELKSGNW